MRVLLVLLKKEFLQFRRNPFIPGLLVVFPVMTMLVFPWVTTMDVRHIGVTVVDPDNSELTRMVIGKVDSSPYFYLDEVVKDYGTALKALEEGTTDAILSLPEGFEKSLVEGSPKKASIDVNAVNAIKGSIGSGYLAGTVASALKGFLVSKGIPLPAEASAEIPVKNLYNPQMEYRDLMIPALMTIMLMLLCGFLPALNIVMEKETGTIEQINVTPVHQFVFILAKLIPYWIIGLFVLAVSMVVAWLLYGLVPVGSFGAIFLAALLFLLFLSGIGVLCANFSSTMLQVIFVMFFFVLIFNLMSGLLTPISSMPPWARNITAFLPPRYFIVIMRDVYLKGSTVADLWWNYGALAGFAIVFDLAAALSYRKRA